MSLNRNSSSTEEIKILNYKGPNFPTNSQIIGKFSHNQKITKTKISKNKGKLQVLNLFDLKYLLKKVNMIFLFFQRLKSVL